VDGAQGELESRAAGPEESQMVEIQVAPNERLTKTIPVAVERKPEVSKVILREALSWLWGDPCVSFHNRNDCAGPRDPFGSMENYAAGRRSPAHEPVRL